MIESIGLTKQFVRTLKKGKKEVQIDTKFVLSILKVQIVVQIVVKNGVQIVVDTVDIIDKDKDIYFILFNKYKKEIEKRFWNNRFDKKMSSRRRF